MKTLMIIMVLFGISAALTAQNKKMPSEALVNLDGATIMSTQILDTASPTMIVFWKSGSNKCCDNLENLQSAWLETLQQQGVKFIAICTDCNGTWSQIKPMAYGKNWEFDIYIDPNGNFKRAMNVGVVPCTMLFDQNQQLLCRNNGYCAGDEELICDKINRHIENTIQFTEAE